MIDINYFRTINRSLGCETKKDYQMNKIAKSYNGSYDKTLSRYQVLKRTKRADIATVILPTGKEKDIACIVDYERYKSLSDGTIAREIWTDINEIRTGDYIKYVDRNSKEEKTYLLKDYIKPKKEYTEALIYPCNNYVTFMIGKEIYKYPCILGSNTLYSDGLDERMQVQFKDNLAGIWVQHNENTAFLKEGMSLIFKSQYEEYNKFRITLKNDFSTEGILMMVAVSTEKNHQTDNLDLCIADYYNNKDDETTGSGSISIEGKISIARNSTNEYFINSADDWEFSVSNDKLATIKKVGKNKIQLTGSSTGELELVASNKKETVILKIQVRGRI